MNKKMPISVEDLVNKRNKTFHNLGNNGKCLTTPWDFNWGNGLERRHWTEGVRGLEVEWRSRMSEI